jgi:hypothetical protein
VSIFKSEHEPWWIILIGILGFLFMVFISQWHEKNIESDMYVECVKHHAPLDCRKPNDINIKWESKTETKTDTPEPKP